MLSFLGTALALLGALWWATCFVGSFVLGMLIAMAGPAGKEWILWKILALPALTLLLAIGEGMLVFGLLLIGSNKPALMPRFSSPIPSNPLPWLLLRSTKLAAVTLAILFASAALFRTLNPDVHPWPDVILCAVCTLAALVARWLLPRLPA